MSDFGAFLNAGIEIDGPGALTRFHNPVQFSAGAIGNIGRGDVYYVDSVNGSANNTGKTPTQALAGIDAAVGKCTANQGDMIVVLPNHVEDLGSGETIDFDVEGITVVGLGQRGERPRIDFNHATASVDVGANNVTIRNLTFRPSVTVVAKGIDIETDVTGTVIDSCEFLDGEAGDGTDEFVLSIALTSGNHDTVIKDCTFRTHASCDGCTDAISIVAASNRVKILNNFFYGNWSTGAIVDDAAGAGYLIVGNKMKVKDGEPGIELQATSTGILADNLVESTGLSDPDTAIVAADCSWFHNYAVTADGGTASLIGAPPSDSLEGSVGINVDSTTTDNLHGKIGTDTEMADNSLYDLLGGGLKTDSLHNILAGTGGITTFPSSAAPANSVSLAEVLRDIWDVLRNGTGGQEPPTNMSIVDLLGNYTGAYDGAAQDDNIKASLDLAHTDLDTIISQLAGAAGIASFPASAAPANDVSLAEVLRDIWDAVRNGTGGGEPETNRSLADYLGVTPAFFVPGLGYRVSKACDLSGANDDLFTVTGKVLITLVVGEVTTVLSGAEAFQLRIKTDNVALCAATTIDTDADGTHYMLSGDFGDAMNGGSTPGLRAADVNSVGSRGSFVVGDAGGSATIESNTTGNGGTITFTLFYLPLEASASVVAAA